MKMLSQKRLDGTISRKIFFTRTFHLFSEMTGLRGYIDPVNILDKIVPNLNDFQLSSRHRTEIIFFFIV